MSTTALATIAELHAMALDERATADLDVGDLDAALLSASSLAYSYLRSRYSLPLVTWGQDLRLAVCRIAAVLVLNKRGWDPSTNAGDAAIQKAHDDSIAWLKDVAANRAAADIVDTSPSATAAPRVVSNPRRGW